MTLPSPNFLFSRRADNEAVPLITSQCDSRHVGSTVRAKRFPAYAGKPGLLRDSAGYQLPGLLEASPRSEFS